MFFCIGKLVSLLLSESFSRPVVSSSSWSDFEWLGWVKIFWKWLGNDWLFRFVGNIEKLLIFVFFIAEWRAGKKMFSVAWQEFLQLLLDALICENRGTSHMPVAFAELSNDVEQIRVLNKSVPGASSLAKIQKELDDVFLSRKLLGDEWQLVFLLVINFGLRCLDGKVLLLERDNC